MFMLTINVLYLLYHCCPADSAVSLLPYSLVVPFYSCFASPTYEFHHYEYISFWVCVRFRDSWLYISSMFSFTIPTFYHYSLVPSLFATY